MTLTDPLSRRLSLPEAAAWLLLFLTVGAWGAAAAAVAVMSLAAQAGGPLGAWLLAAGGDRVMRRCLMACAALFILLLLRRAGWRGWRDCGFDPAVKTDRPWWAWLGLGLGLGLASLGTFSVLTLLLDLRIVTPVATAAEGLRRGLNFIGAGLAVALIEETVCRGMLFLVLARSWGAALAAVLTSLLFALAHFLSPVPEAFQAASFAGAVNAVFVSTYRTALRTSDGLLVLGNLTLLGVALCGFVVRTRSLWLAIGSHAAWVWTIKFFHLWTAAAPGVAPSPWLGARSDFMDGWAATFLLAGLGAWGFWRQPEEVIIRRQGLVWHAAPEAGDSLAAWLEEHTAGGRLQSGTLLKDHHGSLVRLCAGRVLKSSRPKTRWLALHFAVRPSRSRRAFRLGRQLAARGIPTPAPLAWAVRRRLGLLREEFFITAAAAGSEPLTDWLRRNERDPAARQAVLAAYGRLLADLHRAGYSNRDMQHANVLSAVGRPWELQVVDLDGVRWRWWISRRRSGRDLMRVGQSLASLGWVGPEDTAAFFEAYNAGVPPRLRRREFPPEPAG